MSESISVHCFESTKFAHIPGVVVGHTVKLYEYEITVLKENKEKASS